MANAQTVNPGQEAAFRALQAMDPIDPEIDLQAMFLLTQHEGAWRNRWSVLNLGGIMLGGHIAALGIKAAWLSASDAMPTAAQVLFVSGPDAQLPCDLSVTEIRNGKRLAHRETDISQQGRLKTRVTTTLAHPALASSGPAYYHAVPPPAVPPAEVLPTRQELLERLPASAGNLRRSILQGHPYLDIREVPCDPGLDGHGQFWLRVPGAGNLEAIDHYCLLALISDFWFSLPSHNLPGAAAAMGPDIITSSLDHALWFHARPDCSEWMQFDMRATSAGDGLATLQGQAWDSAGRPLATFAQSTMLLTGQSA